MQSLLAAGGVTPACPPPRPGAEVGALAQLPVSKAVASDVRLLRGVSTARRVDPESAAPPAAVTGGSLDPWRDADDVPGRAPPA